MFFEEDDEEENKKVSFRDIVESVNGSINKNESRPSFSDLVEAINPSKKEKVDTSNRTVTVETLDVIDDGWKEAEDVYAKNIDVTQGVNKNSSLYDNKNNRVTQKNVLPTVSKTTETIKGEKTSKQINDEIKAIKKSNQINEDIEKGGVDAFNAIVENTLNAIPGGMKSAVAGLANIATTASAFGVRGLEFISSITGNQETSDRLKEVYNNIIDAGSNIKSEGDHNQNINARIKNGVVRDIGNAIHTVSNVATNAAIGGALGTSGTIIQGLSIGGHSAQEVLDENKDAIGKATLTGIAKGYTSYLIERMFDANILTKGQGSSISNKIDDIIYDSIKNKFGREIANFGAGVVGENIEEIVEGNIDNFIDYLINDKELPTIQEWWEETKETVKLTTLSTIIMNLIPGMGGGRFANKEADIIQRKAQEFIDKGGANLEYDINNKATNTGTVYTTTFENGQITQIQAVEGKEIINPNKKVNIIPAIIRNNETNAYNVIDKNTGVVIDSTPYNSLLSAQAEFNKKMINLKQEQINSINSEVEKLDLTIKNKISEVVEQTKAQINANNYANSQNLTKDNQIGELDNKTTNDVSQNLKSLKNEPDVSNFVTNEKKTRIDNPEVANSIFDSKKSYKIDEIENIYQDLEEIITTNNLENYISVNKTKNNTIEIGEYKDDISSVTTINSIELKPNENGMITGQQINNVIQELAKIENENQPIKGQLDIEGNQVYSEKKGVNKNVRNENTRQKINRTEERKNSRGEEKTSRSNGTNQKELSRGLQKFQKEQRKINKDFTATLADNITETEKIIQNAFSNLTGINYGIFTTNKGTSQGAFFVDNNIFVKHNSFNNKKASNFYPFHEFGHYLKVNKNAEWKAIYNIIDRTITKEQIEKYKDVIKDKAIFKNKSEQEVREYIIEEIESDYIGNWANDIINWKPFIETEKLSNEYIELLIDITNENITTHYNIFGTQEQQEQVYTKITEVMNKVLNKNNVETKENEIKYSDREDVDIIDKHEDVWYDENGIEIDSGKLVEAINTDTPNLKKGRNYKEFGDYFYIFDKITFNKYKVLGTIRIEGNEDLIDSIRGGKRNGIKQKSKDIIGLLKESRYGRRTNNNNNDSSKETRSNRENVGLYNKRSRQSRENRQGQIGRRSNENRNTNLENSNKSSFSMDNKGRTLTKEQQEYFKDSKVRDENGNLLVMYHGTKDIFTVFNNENKKYDTGYAGEGFYFTNNYEIAKNYSNWKKGNNNFEPNVMETYLDLKNPLVINYFTSGIKDAISKQLGIELRPNPMSITAEESKLITNELINKGYDGVLYDFDGDKYAMVINSNQIKNVDNTNPTSNPDIRYSDRIDMDENGQGGFYSQLENVIEQKMPNSSNSQQILNLLKNNGIKQDEIDWIGIEDYINSKKLQKISKQEVLDYIRANQINIETVEKGDSKLRELTDPIKEDIENKNREIKKILDKYNIAYEDDDLIPYKPNGLRLGTIGDFMADSLENLVDLQNFEKQDDETYLNTYNDGTTTWTIGFTEEDLKRDMQKLEDLYEERQQAEFELSSIEDEYGDYVDELGVPKYKDYKLQGGENYREILFTVPSETNIQVDNENYKSPHWQEKNVIAHARTQDFEDVNGDKVLFIDEIQSDMHQEGRKKGYETKENAQKKLEIRNAINTLKNEYLAYEDELKKLKSKAFNTAKEVYIKKQNEAIKQSGWIEEKYNIQNNLTEEQQYELLDYVNKIEQYLIMQNRQFGLFRENIDNNEYMLKQVEEAEKKLNLKLSDEIINKQDNMNKYRQHAIESFRINHYDQHNVHYGTVFSSYNDEYLSEKEQDRIYELKKLMDNIEDERVKLEVKRDKYKTSGISDLFPFKKNWHEFVLRRTINNAVLQGYDKVAWTTGRQQNQRYNLSTIIDAIEYSKNPDGTYNINTYKDDTILIEKEDLNKEELEELIGINLTNQIIESKNEIGEIEGTNLETGGEGMKGFYDKIIPDYLNKYLKKWNSKVEIVTLKDADGKEQSEQMGFAITEEMKKSVKEQGQPLYSNRNLTEETTPYDERVQAKNKEFIAEYKKKMYTEDLMNIPNDQGLTNAQGSNRLIEQEIQKIEKTGKWDNSIPVTKLTDIRKTIEDYLGLGIKRGKFRQRAYGIYKQGRDVIRVKEYKDMDNVLHETGHALDLGNRLKIDKETIADELLAATAAHGGYENESKTVKLDEGFAEILKEYAIVPKETKIHYHQTVTVIEQIRVNDKEFDAFISKLQKQIYNYIHQNPSNRVLSNISIGEQTDKRQLSKAWIKQEVMRNVYDKDYALKSAVNELAKAGGKTVNEIRASQNAYYLTRLASGIDSKITSMLSNGYIDENGNQIMPGLNQIGDILGNNPARFNDLRAFLVAQRDLEYKAKSLKTGIRTLDSKAVVERFKNDSQIQRAAKVVYQTLDGVLQYAQNNKLISEEEANALRKSNAFYVPMQRVIENNSNNVGKRGAVADIIKKRTGSELDVKDVLENIIANSANVIQQVENNSILKALYTEGEKSKLTGAIYDVIPAPMVKIGTAKLQTWQKELEDQGIDISKIDFDKTIDLFSPNNKIDTRNLITSFINDQGKRIYLQFNDELIFNSLMNLDKQMMSQVLKINNKLNMPLRYGATMANVGFAIPNMISDTAQAAIYSNAGFIPIVDNAIGIIEILGATNKTARNFLDKLMPGYAERINNLYTMYQQSGASSATRLSQYRKSAQEIMKEVYGTSSKNLGIEEKYKPLKVLLDIMTFIPELSEQSTRFRVFERNYEAYKNKGNSEVDARILAALESRDATQDFGRTGNLTREINQVIPFSAARVGSAYTFAEKVKANPKQTGMRIAILTVIAMAIKAIGYDDEEIEELNQRKKDDNFVIKVGNTVMTIKKPQGILRSIINLAEYIQDLFTGNIEDGKEGERLGEWINNAIMDNMPADSITGLVPNMVAPLIENAINKDFYYNTEIVKSYDLDLPDSEQYYDYTSQLAILLGKIFNYSPAKIDNLINGYFAGLGTSVTNVLDWVAGKVGISAEEPNMGAEDNAVGKRFVVNVNENSASIDEIYDLKTELTKKKNGETITEEETEKLETITEAISNISKINKQIKEIKRDLTMSANEKANKIRKLQGQKTDMARQALGKELINKENEEKIESTQFYTTSETLKKNGYRLDMTSEMKKEYEELAYNYYKKYEQHGLYSEEKLETLKTRSKEYAKNELFKKYKSKIYKEEK